MRWTIRYGRGCYFHKDQTCFGGYLLHGGLSLHDAKVGSRGCPVGSARWVTPVHPLAMLSEHDLREDLLSPPEGLVDRLFWRHPVLDDIGMGLAPELLGIHLAPGWVETLVGRSRRPKDGLGHIGG